MTEPGSPPTPSAGGVLSRSGPEIQRVLDSLRSREVPVVMPLQGGGLLFQSKLRLLDPQGRRILIESSPDPAVNAALLARPRCTFHAEVAGWHVEFVAADPREAVHDGVAMIELRYPELLISVPRRTQPRVPVSPQLPLQCLADAGGITPFDASIADIGSGGIGFMVYDLEIALEPGTILKGCRIAMPDGGSESVDLEVRYTQPVMLADGRRGRRSGCRFVDPSPRIRDFVRRCLGDDAPDKR